MIKLTQPSNVPNFCFVIVEVETQRDILIQSENDYAGVARSFGWTGGDNDLSGGYAWLCKHIGDVVEDPGYFTGDKA